MAESIGDYNGGVYQDPLISIFDIILHKISTFIKENTP